MSGKDVKNIEVLNKISCDDSFFPDEMSVCSLDEISLDYSLFQDEMSVNILDEIIEKNKIETNEKKVLKIEKERDDKLNENMKRQISNNLVISFILSLDPDLTENDARSRAETFYNNEYSSIVIVMKMELNELVFKIYSKPINEITIREYLMISENMVRNKGNYKSIIDEYENITIEDL